MLSKSDFQLASSCPKKLVYKKKGYLTSNDTDEYMEMLAQGGYMIGKMAMILYTEGIEITGNTAESLDKTKELMLNDRCVLFEPAFIANQKLVRVDILVKDGNQLHLIEVKAKSHNSEDDKASIQKKLAEYIDDVAYQYLVLSESLPEFKIRCSLLTPDKAKRTNIDGLAGWFSIAPEESENEIEELPAQSKMTFKKPIAIFKYENSPNRDDYCDLLKKDGILEYLDVTQMVVSSLGRIKTQAENYIRILNEGITIQDYILSKGCKGCEFNPKDISPNGYKECWGANAEIQPHIFDLYYGGSIGHYTKGWYLDELIEKGKVSLYNIDLERLKNSKGLMSTRGIRQALQINNTKNNTEWKSPDLNSVLASYTYPLHFIDFETYTGALPFHKEMRPYELIAFQWSCHTIKSAGELPIHSEWIHTDSDFPNFKFAESLMKQIGTTGTPFMWAPHENTVLRTIMDQMALFNYNDSQLKNWIEGMTHDKDLGRVGKLVDMNRMTQEYYFHPHMKGRTSIKKVLPAIWNHNPYLHNLEHFKEYTAKSDENIVIDPYDTLSIGLESENDSEIVKGGTAAMRAYYRIRFDNELSKQQKDELKRQLLQYCKLDTMAMVIIAYHWGLK